jgi:exportin-7
VYKLFNLFAGPIDADSTVSSSCSASIDHLATYMFLNMTKDKATVNKIRMHVSAEPELLHTLMATLFNTLLFTTNANHWAITRPMLSILLVSEASFNDYQNQLISTQAPDKQDKLREEFGKLTHDIQRSVDSFNRDKFTQRLTVFRLNVRQFLTL